MHPFPYEGPRGKQNNDDMTALLFIRDYLKENCELQTDSERKFLDCYFEFIRREIGLEGVRRSIYGHRPPQDLPPPFCGTEWAFYALLPLPQAHLYIHNPLERFSSWVPERMVKVDFAFWTGEEIVAIEIDGSSHIGSENHITKDRALAREGVKVIHILNNELMEYGASAIECLLPAPITNPWWGLEKDDSGLLWGNPLVGPK